MSTLRRHNWRAVPSIGKGFALIALMSILTMGVLYFLLVQLEAVHGYRRRNGTNRKTMTAHSS